MSKNKSKVLKRDQILLMLYKNIHDDNWHCSKSEDGLVEIQFYVTEETKESNQNEDIIHQSDH